MRLLLLTVVALGEEWGPEMREFWSTRQDDAAAMKEAVATELRRSLAVYPATSDYLTRTLREERREDYVLIWENKIYVDRAFVNIDKNNRHLQFVWSVSQIRDLPNVAYIINRFAQCRNQV